MSDLIPQDLSVLTKDELKELLIKIQFLLELQENFKLVPIVQEENA